nr:hypothetical protein [uncultured Allomuricauda sp.]
MKRVLLLCTVLLWMPFYGQDEAKESQDPELIGQIIITEELYVLCEKLGDTYHIRYSDASLSQATCLQSFTVKEGNGEFEKFYRSIVEGHPTVPCRGSKVPLTTGEIWLEFTKSEGIVSVRFLQNMGLQDVSYSPWLTKKEIMNLLGKGPNKTKSNASS